MYHFQWETGAHLPPKAACSPFHRTDFLIFLPYNIHRKVCIQPSTLPAYIKYIHAANLIHKLSPWNPTNVDSGIHGPNHGRIVGNFTDNISKERTCQRKLDTKKIKVDQILLVLGQCYFVIFFYNKEKIFVHRTGRYIDINKVNIIT